ncbi:MAG: hypothetical protein ABH878_08015 [bacterium]
MTQHPNTAEFLSENGNPKVLCYSPYNRWTLHGLWEMTILHALKLRGAAVHTVFCDGLFSDCDVFWAATCPRHHLSCVQCQAEVSALALKMDMPYEWLGRYTTPEDFQKARDWVETLTASKITKAQYQGWRLGDWVKSSVHSHLRTSQLDLDQPSIQEAYRSYLYSGFLACQGLSRLLDHDQPNVLLLFNGRMSSARIALELAVERGIRVICHERGLLSDSIILTENRTCISLEPMRQIWQNWRTIPLQLNELEKMNAP